MKLDLETEQQGGAYFIQVDHMREDKKHTTFIRMDDVKSWRSAWKTKAGDEKAWILTTVQGDVYYTVENFRHIMSSADWYPREVDIKKNGRRTWERWTKD